MAPTLIMFSVMLMNAFRDHETFLQLGTALMASYSTQENKVQTDEFDELYTDGMVKKAR